MIDWIRIAELHEDFGAEDFNDIVAAFLEEADDALARLLDADTSAELQAEFHFMKGAALNLGFDEIAAICSSGEQAAAECRPADTQRAQLQQTLPRTIATFKTEWRSRLGVSMD